MIFIDFILNQTTDPLEQFENKRFNFKKVDFIFLQNFIYIIIFVLIGHFFQGFKKTYFNFQYLVIENIKLVIFLKNFYKLIYIFISRQSLKYFYWDFLIQKKTNYKVIFFKKTSQIILVNLVYNFVKNVIFQNIVKPVFFPYSILLLFAFLTVRVCNIIGIIPYVITVTSQIFTTLSLAVIYFITFVVDDIRIKKIEFLSKFVPKDVPLYILPLLIPIEFISYGARIISLAIRLFANLTAGHTLIKILSKFLSNIFVILAVFTFGAVGLVVRITVITVLELIIAFLQAYVFLILLAIYMSDLEKRANEH
jgi:F-type H+-transporting ATPase subunit a